MSKAVNTVFQDSLSTGLQLVEAPRLVLPTESIPEVENTSQAFQYLTKLVSVINKYLVRLKKQLLNIY
jgi:hypothetical protein